MVAACTAAVTIATARDFARAWTRGDAAAIVRLTAPEPHYRWVSAGEPGLRAGSRAFDRRSLPAYIRLRHGQHDRLRLTRVKFNGSDTRMGAAYGHFEFDALRAADDWPAGLDHVRHGKGAIVCSLGRPVVAVWSLG